LTSRILETLLRAPLRPRQAQAAALIEARRANKTDTGRLRVAILKGALREEATACTFFALVDKRARTIVTAIRPVRTRLRGVQRLLIQGRLRRPVERGIRPTNSSARHY